LQGIDYAYTVQGWLKSINPSWITPAGTAEQFDSDGMSSPALFERDAYKLNLNYFDDGTYTDFSPIGPQSGYVQGNRLPSASKKNLYNGNIGSMAIDIRALATSGSRDLGPMIYNYGYDQLNRISCMNAWAANDSLKSVNTLPMNDYAERYSYDPNGNILTLNRTGDSLHPAKAKLTYNYIYKKTGSGTGEYVPGSAPTSGVAGLTNQLSSIQVSDSGSTVVNPNELGTQAAFNYHYNEIGQLTDDDTAKIHGITWNVYGKILSLVDTGNTITFTYDAAGNRISKSETRNDTTITTWYVRDAQGNVMSIYTQNPAVHSDSLTQTEADIYGSSRLGLLNLSVNCGGSLTQLTQFSLVRGSKLFELTNHLGNVLETISDKKIQHTSDSSTVDYYLADVINANDYYSFGMGMPARSFNATSAGSYRYGFNGKEDDNEVKGAGDQIDYGFRTYDPRVGRFLSVDPLMKKYPNLTPYQFASNTPVWGSDLDGLEVDFSNAKLPKEQYVPGLPKILQLSTFGDNVAYSTYNSIVQDAQDVSNIIVSSKGRKEVINKYGDAALKLAFFTQIPIQEQYASLKRYFSDVNNVEDFAGNLLAGSIEGLGTSLVVSETTALVSKGVSYMALYEGNYIINSALQDGMKIVIAGPDELKYMEAANAKALYLGGEGKEAIVVIQADAPRSHILEEAIHHQQRLTYGDDYVRAHSAELEVQAQDELIRIGEKEKWSKEELDEIKGARNTWQKAVDAEKKKKKSTQ
jgi:RHS repeat-associated protein